MILGSELGGGIRMINYTGNEVYNFRKAWGIYHPKIYLLICPMILRHSFTTIHT